MTPGELVRLSWRNLGRNRRRTIITVAAISISLALLVVSSDMGDGFHQAMIAEGVSYQAGHVVVQAPDYQAHPEASKVVPDAPAVEATVARAVPGAKVVPRVFLQGLLSTPENSVGVQVTGVDPALEASVESLPGKIVKGSYLEPNDDRGIVFGTTLAETLGVGLGDKVVLMAQRGGEIQSRLFRVKGLFRTGSQEIDGFYAQVPLAAAQAVLGVGQGVNQLSVHLQDEHRTPEATAQVKRALAGQRLEVLPWQAALPELHQFVVVDDGGLYAFVIIIAVIVALGILNTILMSVLERTHEFGVLLALGMTPWGLAGMVMAEAALLGLLAAALGGGLGALGSLPLDHYGIDYARMIGQGTEVGGVVMGSTRVFGRLSVEKTVFFATVAWLITVSAAIYPTWKAARLRPVDAFRHV
ncbi:MAG: ABC transporter permease [Deltaproteobacteria bacterium]|nr:ABC transporter permease [Deltaproteobacteria bacterium]